MLTTDDFRDDSRDAAWSIAFDTVRSWPRLRCSSSSVRIWEYAGSCTSSFPSCSCPFSSVCEPLSPPLLFADLRSCRDLRLAITLSVDSLFVDDYHSGALDWMLLSTGSGTAVAAAKLAGFWLVAALPQILAALAAGLVLGYSGSTLLTLGTSLGIGSFVLCGTGGIASALTVGLRSGGVLVAIITLPLSIPTLIFGTGAVHHAVAGRDPSAELYFLAGLAVLSLTLTPFATAAALRVRMT